MKLSKNYVVSALSVIAATATFSGAPTKASADEPFLGDIIAVGFNFCPRGWTAAEGQLLPISSNTALFSLLGTTYGGDGRSTFGLPDLRGRTAMGQGSGPGLTPTSMGTKKGAEAITLTVAQMPPHRHTVRANNLDGDKAGPGGKLLAAAPPSGVGSETIYSTEPATTQMSAAMISPSGGGQPMAVQDPYLVMRYCIALTGVYPSRS